MDDLIFNKFGQMLKFKINLLNVCVTRSGWQLFR